MKGEGRQGSISESLYNIYIEEHVTYNLAHNWLATRYKEFG